MSTQPAPITFEPSGQFLGNDGLWSTFEIEIGVPPQKVQVLPSSEIAQTLVIAPDGCPAADDDEDSNYDCSNARGGIYHAADSRNWVLKNNFTLGIAPNLGLAQDDNTGSFGYDTIAIPTASGGNVTLNQQLLSGVITPDFYLGLLGLSSRPTSFESQVKGQPPDTRQSLIQSLKDQNLIPSLSYGYTAGASYRKQNASLTLGGYDASRFVPNDLSIEFAPNPVGQLVIALKTITFSDSDSSDKPLLTKGILTLIDSTVPEIWLPLDACQAFEAAFGITYESISNRYLVNSTQHDDLRKQNASVSFEFGSSLGSGDSITITLPYESFDLEIDHHPNVKKASKYFPLRHAADDTQYVMGRTLLQESFLTVDYGSQTFSLSQLTTSDSPSSIVPISASNATATTPQSTQTPTPTNGPAIVKTVNKSTGFPVAAIAGIVVPLVLIILAIGGYFWWKNSKKHKMKDPGAPELPTHAASYPPNHKEMNGNSSGSSLEKREAVEASAYAVPTGMESPRFEMGDDRVYFEGTHNSYGHGPTTELPTDLPPRSELSSPEPISRGASPTPGVDDVHELSSRDPNYFMTEIDSPAASAQTSPHLEPYSPRFPRPPMGNRRSALERLNSTASDDSGFMPIQRNDSQRSTGKDGMPLRPPHDRKASNDSEITQDTIPARRPSHLRKDSTESGFTFNTMGRRPSFNRVNSTDSDPLMSPKPIHSNHPFTARESTMEEETDSDAEIHQGELVRRGSAQLITQMSPPASPNKPSMPTSSSKPSIPRKEVASSASHSQAHARQESGGSLSPFQSPTLGSSPYGRVRSNSSTSRFTEAFHDEPDTRESLDLKRS